MPSTATPETQLETCPNCGLALPRADSARHPYLGASAACWALYGEVLAREYGDPAFMAVHRLTVDAYAAQHPGLPERRTIQSINLHLVALYLSLERRLNPGFITRAIAALTRETTRLEWLEPPPSLGEMTVADVAAASTPEAHGRLVADWAGSVWRAWAPHHRRVIGLAEQVAGVLG